MEDFSDKRSKDLNGDCSSFTLMEVLIEIGGLRVNLGSFINLRILHSRLACVAAQSAKPRETSRRGAWHVQKCSSSRKFVILLIISSCYCFGGMGIVSVVRSIVLSKGNKPIM